MLDNPHECAGGCQRTIQGAHDYCLFCRSKLRKNGQCQFCGFPLPMTADPAGHTKTCKAALVARSNELAIPRGEMSLSKHRGQDSRENTYDTKRGG